VYHGTLRSTCSDWEVSPCTLEATTPAFPPASLELGKYCCARVDAVCGDGTMFHMTVNSTPSVSAKFVQALIDRNRPQAPKVMFAVPADVFDKFKYQPFTMEAAAETTNNIASSPDVDLCPAEAWCARLCPPVRRID